MRKYYGEKKPDREFSSTQVDLPSEVAGKVHGLAKSIPDADLAEDGRESEPHITVKFGLHDAEPSSKLRSALKSFGPISATIGKTSLFRNDEHDVVKLDIFSPDLHRLNKLIADLAPNTDTHPSYIPHATLAYVKKGRGDKHSGKTNLFGTKVKIGHVTFSSKTRQNHKLPLA